MCQHHIVTDRQSLFILTREMWSLYQAFHQGRPPPLPELPMQYGDYAVWQQQSLDAQALQHRLEYWREWLAPDEPNLLELPTDRPRQHKTFRANSLRYTLTPDLSARVRQAGQATRATPLMIGLSALAALLYRYSQCADIIIGTTFSYRENHKLKVLVGPLASVLQIRLNLQGNPTFKALVRQTHQALQEAITHQDVPFQHIANKYRMSSIQDPSIPFVA